MATEITIVRHGETEWNSQKRIQGQNNSNLTENGIIQAHRVAEALSKRDFDMLISSDLGRAIETAEIINQELNLPYFTNANLRERSLGIIEGKTYNEAKQLYPADFEKFLNRDPNYSFPNGESLQQLYTRVVTTINNIEQKYNGQKILIVSHGLVLEMMMYKTFNIPLTNQRSFSINNSSISSFYINNDNWFLKEWGVIEHLVSLNVLNEL